MPDRSTCEWVARQLWPYVDERLSDEDREAVITHLEGCDRCQSHIDFAREFLVAVGKVGPRAVPSEALQSRVLSALAGAGFNP